MPAIADILGFPPHGGNHIKGGGGGARLDHMLTERIHGRGLGGEGDWIQRVILRAHRAGVLAQIPVRFIGRHAEVS